MIKLASLFLLCLSAHAADINPFHASRIALSPKLKATQVYPIMVRYSVVLPLAPTVTISWNYNLPTNNITFEVWRSTNLINWSLFTVTNANSTQTTANLPCEYFKVRAVYWGQYPSQWATN